MATSYHQHMVTLVMVVFVSMLLTVIYFTKISPSSVYDHAYRREFLTRAQYNQFSHGHGSLTTSLAVDKASVRALVNQTHGVEVLKFLNQPSSQNLIDEAEAMNATSHGASNSLKTISTKINNASMSFKERLILKLPREKTTKAMLNEGRTNEVVADRCSPKKNIVLLKTHKTGSSTVQNILYRFGDNHDLVFALPKGRDNYFGFNAWFSRSFVNPVHKRHQVNILANHARWNKREFVALMPADTVYITILRHPANQYESLYIYYKWEKFFKVPFYEFVKDPAKFCNMYGHYASHAPVHSFKNPSLYDLGIKLQSKPFDKNFLKGKITSLGEDFQLVLIMEYMEESIILLKELMCWSWEDVLYFTTNARSEKEINELTLEVKEKLIEWNDGDWMLFKYFNETLWRKVKDYGFERMQQDKIILRKKIEEMKEKCLKGIKVVSEIGTTIQRFQLSDKGMNDKTCSQMVRKALSYLYLLNDKMAKLS